MPNLDYFPSIVKWGILTLAAFFAVFAMKDLVRSDYPRHFKVTMSLLILLLPIIGATLYFFHRESIEDQS